MSAHTVLLAALATTAVLCALGGAQAEYTADAAMSALQFVKATTCPVNDIRSWNCEACKANQSFGSLNVIENQSAGTLAYVGFGNGRIVVAFRGTDHIKNWLKNFDIFRSRYPNSNCSKCGVHNGFLNAYKSLKNNMLQAVQTILNSNSVRSILVTGHNLGGAMATLAAADIAHLQNSSGATPHIDLYTFGSPRVGNQQFVNWFAGIFCSGGHASYRVTHKRDMVPHLPPHFAGYVHVSREYFYNNDQNTDWVECYDISENDCSDKTVTEDKKCNFQFWRLNGKDHDLYLGKSTGCSLN